MNNEEEQTEDVLKLQPASLRVKCGDEIKLIGAASMTIRSSTWFHGENIIVIDDNRTCVKHNDKTVELIVKNAEQDDTGCYTLLVRHQQLNYFASSSITVEGTPEAPRGCPDAYSVTRNSINLSWYGPGYDGGTPVIGYCLQMKTKERNDWVSICEDCQFTSYKVYNLEENKEYSFRVSCFNKHGFGPVGLPSQPILTLGGVSDCSSNEHTNKIMLSPIIVSCPISPQTIQSAKDELTFTPRQVEIQTNASFHDNYILGELLGSGKFGSVYKCLCKNSGKEFAAKLIRCRPSMMKNMRNEVMIMNQLHHPKLLLLWDAFETTKEFTLVMELVKGNELLDRVTNDDYILTEKECVHFIRQICDGVTYMHHLSVVHLDLKPENILCVSEFSDQIKIVDFGLALKLDDGRNNKVMVGTAEFVAPEIINFDCIDLKTDMWSVGVITYLLLTGISPFSGDTDAETLANVTRGKYEMNDDVFSDISPSAVAFIKSLLVKNIKMRMSSEEGRRHEWLSDDVTYMKAKRISTAKHKKFLARRNWRKSSTAIQAVKRISTKELHTKSLSNCDLLEKDSGFTKFVSVSNSTSNSPSTPMHQRMHLWMHQRMHLQEVRRNSLPISLSPSQIKKIFSYRESNPFIYDSNGLTSLDNRINNRDGQDSPLVSGCISASFDDLNESRNLKTEDRVHINCESNADIITDMNQNNLLFNNSTDIKLNGIVNLIYNRYEFGDEDSMKQNPNVSESIGFNKIISANITYDLKESKIDELASNQNNINVTIDPNIKCNDHVSETKIINEISSILSDEYISSKIDRRDKNIFNLLRRPPSTEEQFNTYNALTTSEIGIIMREYKIDQNNGGTIWEMSPTIKNINDKKEKSTDCDSALIPLLCVHG